MYQYFKKISLIFLLIFCLFHFSQQEKIKNLEDEMVKLKTECNYKMTKVQQKTQEYVTSEYEKKFERKREQMVNC